MLKQGLYPQWHLTGKARDSGKHKIILCFLFSCILPVFRADEESDLALTHIKWWSIVWPGRLGVSFWQTETNTSKDNKCKTCWWWDVHRLSFYPNKYPRHIKQSKNEPKYNSLWKRIRNGEIVKSHQWLFWFYLHCVSKPYCYYGTVWVSKSLTYFIHWTGCDI